jgi:hypothetical protein
MKTNTMLIAVIVMVAAGGTLADWPQYLGPNRNAISPEKGLLRSWPEAGPESAMDNFSRSRLRRGGRQ